jgi:hypothetical protein
VLRLSLFVAVFAACGPRPQPIVYLPTEPGAPGQGGNPPDQPTEPRKPGEPPPPDLPRQDFAVPTLPMWIVLDHGTLVWADLAGAVWTMPADGSTPPKQLSDQHKQGLVVHPFHAGDRVLAKAGHELVSITVPDGPVTRVHVTGVPDLPEEITADASAVYLTVFNHQQVMRVPVSGGAAEKLLEVPNGLLALHGDTLYIASNKTGELLAVPTAGGKPRTIATKLHQPTAIAADDKAVYVYTEGDERVSRIDPATGVATALGDNLNNSDELTLAGDGVYTVSWPGKLVKLSKQPGKAAVTLLDDLHKPRSIVADDKWIYVTSDEPPRIVRVARP